RDRVGLLVLVLLAAEEALGEPAPPAAGCDLLAGVRDPLGRQAADGSAAGVDPRTHPLVALALVLPCLEQALELVGVAGEPGLHRLLRLVLVHERRDGPGEMLRQACHLVAHDLLGRRRMHVAAAYRGNVADT